MRYECVEPGKTPLSKTPVVCVPGTVIEFTFAQQIVYDAMPALDCDAFQAKLTL